MGAWLKSADFDASLRAVAAVLGFHIAPEGGTDGSGGDLGAGFAVKGLGFTATFALGFTLTGAVLGVVLGAAAVACSAVAEGVEAACSTAGAGSAFGVEEELFGIFQCDPLPFVGVEEDCVESGVGVADAGAGVEVAGDESVE